MNYTAFSTIYIASSTKAQVEQEPQKPSYIEWFLSLSKFGDGLEGVNMWSITLVSGMK